MKRNIFSILTMLLLAVVFATGLTSCESWLKEKTFAAIQPDDIPDSNDGATQWVMGVYNAIQGELFVNNEFPWPFEFDCDYLTGPDWAFGSFGAGNFQGNSYCDNTWIKFYNIIHRANYAMECVNKMGNVTPEYKANVMGELKFLKAWSYFVLVRAYGALPLRYESVNTTNKFGIPRSSVNDVYGHIIDLLKESQDEVYKNTDSGYSQGRLSAGAPAALLAKAYITMAAGAMPTGTQVKVKGGKPWSGEGATRAYTNPKIITHSKKALAGYEFAQTSKELFVMARDQAFDVMQGEYGNYDLMPYDQLWKKERNQTEHIWALMPVSGDVKFGVRYPHHYCGYEENGLIINGLWYGCRDHWYKMMESTDYRAEKGVSHRWQRNWSATEGQYYPDTEEMRRKVFGYIDIVSGETIPPQEPYNDGLSYRSPQFDVYFLAYPTKYYDRTDKSAQQSDGGWTFLRYADIVLIYAEAAAEANDSPTTDALNALNDVRTRSNATLKSLAGANNIGDLVDFRSAILEERAIELACEGDRRWDLIRWGIYVDVMNAIGGVDEINVYKARSDKHTLWPIPEAELNTNVAITDNNPGWD